MTYHSRYNSTICNWNNIKTKYQNAFKTHTIRLGVIVINILGNVWTGADSPRT